MAKGRKSPATKLVAVAEAPVTIQCVWRPASESPAGYDPGRGRWHRGDESALGTEMRLWGSAERYAFCRLQEGVARNNLKPRLQEVFGLNSRYCDDAIVHAKAIIDSQHELIPAEIEATEAKLAKANKKQKADRAKAVRLRKAGNVSMQSGRSRSSPDGNSGWRSWSASSSSTVITRPMARSPRWYSAAGSCGGRSAGGGPPGTSGERPDGGGYTREVMSPSPPTPTCG